MYPHQQFGGRMPGGALQRQDSGSAMMHHMAVNPIGGMGTEVPKLERFWKVYIFIFCEAG